MIGRTPFEDNEVQRVLAVLGDTAVPTRHAEAAVGEVVAGDTIRRQPS